MEITESIINRINQFGKQPILVGVCGRAGAGKTTLTGKINKELTEKQVKSIFYSGDWRFYLDSESRKKALQEKWFAGMEEYLRMINQFNWWDFEKISQDLSLLKRGQNLLFENAYNRKSGKKDEKVEIVGISEGVIFYENCILGGIDVLKELDLVILLNTPDEVCFQRLLDKDAGKRTFPEVLGRELMTLSSENIFFKFLLEKFQEKLLVCNSEGFIGAFPKINEVKQIPVPTTLSRQVNATKGAIFCDLDGVLIKHVPVPSETGEEIEIIDGSAEKLKEFRNKGYYLVMTTSRPYYKIFGIIDKLKSFGVEFDQIISDLPVGARHLINDSKDGEIRTTAHPLERDRGLKDIKID